MWDSSPGLPHIVSHFWVYFLFFFFFKTFCIFSLLAALARVVLFCRQPLELEMSNPSFCHQWLVKEPALIARLCNSNSLESCCKSLGLSSPRPGATSSSSLFFARKHWSHFSILIFFLKLKVLNFAFQALGCDQDLHFQSLKKIPIQIPLSSAAGTAPHQEPGAFLGFCLYVLINSLVIFCFNCLYMQLSQLITLFNENKLLVLISSGFLWEESSPGRL